MKNKFFLHLVLQLCYGEKIILTRSEATTCETAEIISDTFYFLLGKMISTVFGLLVVRQSEARADKKVMTCKVSAEIRYGDLTVKGEADGSVRGNDVMSIYAVAGISICRALHKAIKEFRPKSEVS